MVMAGGAGVLTTSAAHTAALLVGPVGGVLFDRIGDGVGRRNSSVSTCTATYSFLKAIRRGADDVQVRAEQALAPSQRNNRD